MAADSLWIDLTVHNADAVRDFYADVVGWTPSPVPMGGYEDYAMKTSDDRVVAGICNARGVNQGLPPVWLPYFKVESLDDSLSTCARSGGTQVGPVRTMGTTMRYAVVRDPAGAHAVLFEDLHADEP